MAERRMIGRLDGGVERSIRGYVIGICKISLCEMG